MSWNKTVLVTGADGFIGSHLTELLVQNGAKVRALCQYNSFGFKGWLENSPIKDQVEIIFGDIRDKYFCDQITKNVDVVFHLAALIAIPYSYKAPESYIETNVIGTSNICLAGLKNNVDKIIHTSTSECYGTAQYVPIDEKHPKQAQSPYSASKISADAMAISYFNAFDLPIQIARPFNTYGPRQSNRAVIPAIITQIASGIKEISLGDLSPTRDFNYVTDTCEGILQIAKLDSHLGEEFNIASNFEISIQDTLNLIKKLMNSDVDFITDQQRLRPKNSEVFRLWGDSSKLNSLTDFIPQNNIEQGLSKTIEWFSKSQNLSHYNLNDYQA